MDQIGTDSRINPSGGYGRSTTRQSQNYARRTPSHRSNMGGNPGRGHSMGREHSAMMEGDITSITGYTITGQHVQQENFNSRQLTSEHVSLLLKQGYSLGLAKALAANADSFDHRIWVVDNSGSMQIGDGHKVTEKNGKVALQPVSRWEEIQETVIYHCQMAAALNSRTKFRLLNDPGPSVGTQEFSIAEAGSDVDRDIRHARHVINGAKPDGVTPLTQHIREMQSEIRRQEQHLRRTGRKVAVILATDGLPTDEQGYGGDDITDEFIRALNSLEGLPVWLVIRLCTDEEQVTDFYNQLDGKLELSLEVLDDFLSECNEVHAHNPWLNYALPMHRCRELGYHDRLFDLIDERALTKGELRDFCALLFGTEIDAIPDPVVDWKEFTTYIQRCLSEEKLQWNPKKKKEKPWIDVKQLNKAYRGQGCVIL